MARRSPALVLFALGIAACGPDSLSAPPSATSRPSPALSVEPLSASTVVVKPSAMNGWSFVSDNDLSPCASPTCEMVAGPSTTPTGTGSAQISVAGTGDRNMLALTAYQGVPFASVTRLEYSTLRQSADAGNVLALALQFNVDYDLTDGNTSWQSRIVFEPYLGGGSGNIPQNTWQTWDTRDGTASGRWWGPSSASCPQNSPCTWAQLLAAYPNIGVHATLGAVLIKAGGGWTGFTGNVDKLVIGVNGDETTYDFEPDSHWGACVVDDDGSTYTLLANCVTDETLVLPDGYTLDGHGFSITAVDPTGGHFLGAVVTNGGTTAHVTDVVITASGLVDACDAGSNRLRGILFEGAGGSITGSTVAGVRQGPSGCQEGNAIEVRNFDVQGNPAPDQMTVTISGNTVADYQKNGITANGNVAATITGNHVAGDGPVTYIAQNGVQVGFGATALVQDNDISGNDYTPSSFVACGLLMFDGNGVKQKSNALTGNERDVCNFGRGGGKFNPEP